MKLQELQKVCGKELQEKKKPIWGGELKSNSIGCYQKKAQSWNGKSFKGKK